MSGHPYSIGRLTRKRTDGAAYWTFCIIWWENGQRRRVSLGTTDRVAADAAARKVWASMQGRNADTVGQVIALYLDSLGGSKDEQRKRDGWKQARGYWEALRISTVDRQTSLGYPAWRKRAVNTVRNELSLIRTALIWAEREKMIDKAPHITVPAVPRSSVSHLTKEQFRTFLAGCAMPHVKLFAILAVTTGARKAALLEARWSQVDWDRRALDLNVEGGQTKGNKGRAVVALNDRAMEALREAVEGKTCEHIIEYRCGPIEDIKRGIEAASVRSGVRCHPHMFRHSAAVWMAEDRVPMAEIAQFLGHRSTAITERVYARFHPDYLQRAARSLDW